MNKIGVLLFLVLGFGLINVSAQPETPKKISGGVLNGKAKNLVKPAYPAAAKAVNASGAVNVQITIDEEGNVAEAAAVSGHPLLRQAAEQAARASTFAPTTLSGQPVRVTGVLVYNFVGGGPNWSGDGTALGISEIKGMRGRVNLPENFTAEQEQLDAIGKLSADEQKTQIPSVVSLIKSKLSVADLWRFEFGLTRGRIVAYLEDKNDASVMSELAKFRELATNRADGVQEPEFARAVELAKFADKTSLTAEDKQAMFAYLR